MIIFGLGARQIVAWSREPRNFAFEPTFPTTQLGSWLQWYQERPIRRGPCPRSHFGAWPDRSAQNRHGSCRRPLQDVVSAEQLTA